MKRLLLALCLLAPAAALAATPPISVWIDYPLGSDFVFGRVDFIAKVVSQEEIAKVEFWLDGRQVAIMTKPPWRITIDVGQENVKHRFRVLARTVSGEEAEASLTTPALKIDDTVEIELQQLYVTVTENGGRVLDLERDDFRVHDEGTRQKIVTFERGDIPLTAALVLDCSLSMTGGRLEAALAGAGRFIQQMNPLDEAMVMLFSDHLLRTTEFTSEKAVLERALEGVTPSGGTSLNDHLFVALHRLDRRQGRRVVVLFSDGVDVHSVLEMQSVLDKARQSQALIYWIHLRRPGEGDELPERSSSWRNVARTQAEFRRLRQAVETSGGRIQVVERLEGLSEAFAGILSELREQYVLGYYPDDPRGDGSWRKVSVRVDRLGVRVRTREGYLDF